MPANPIHHTDTVDTPWDGPAEEARLSTPVTKARGNGMYAWHDPAGDDGDGDGYPDAKADSKFPHHMVDADGNPGLANMAGCRAIMQRLDQADIPAADDAEVKAHAQSHMDDGMPAGAGQATIVAPSRYGHITRAIFDRPWAVQEATLKLIVDVVRRRAAGDPLSQDQIIERLAAAAQFNGERTGGGTVGPVAIIPLYGLISQRMGLMSMISGGTSIDALRGDFRDALADPAVRAIVFDVDSEGGSTDGVTEFASEIRAARGGSKPIVAQVNTLCASAAAWLALQCDEVVITPSGEIGSIGVWAAHEDDSAALEMAGVKITLISAGPYKTEMSPYQALTDHGLATVQEQVDTFYSMFLADVAKGRRTTIDNVASGYGEGSTLLAQKALAAGMVDRIDTLEATVRRLQPKALSAPRAAARALSSPTAATAASPAGRPDGAWNRRMKGRLP